MLNNSSDCLNDLSCFIIALYYIRLTISENDNSYNELN